MGSEEHEHTEYSAREDARTRKKERAWQVAQATSSKPSCSDRRSTAFFTHVTQHTFEQGKNHFSECAGDMNKCHLRHRIGLVKEGRGRVAATEEQPWCNAHRNESLSRRDKACSGATQIRRTQGQMRLITRHLCCCLFRFGHRVRTPCLRRESLAQRFATTEQTKKRNTTAKILTR